MNAIIKTPTSSNKILCVLHKTERNFVERGRKKNAYTRKLWINIHNPHVYINQNMVVDFCNSMNRFCYFSNIIPIKHHIYIYVCGTRANCYQDCENKNKTCSGGSLFVILFGSLCVCIVVCS